MNYVFSFLLNVGFYVLLMFAIVGAAGVGLLTQFSFDEDRFISVVSSIAAIPVLIIFILLSMLLQSMLIGGLYGSAIESVFENRSSIGTYFTHIHFVICGV